MNMLRIIFALCYIGTFVPCSALAQNDTLRTYVEKPDDSYAWTLVDTKQVGAAEIAEIVLTSQTWRRKLWKHLLFVIKPPQVATDGQAILVIGGGRWRDAIENRLADAKLPDEAEMFAALAERMQTIVIVVAQVPFQPLFHRREDELIAYTFDKYLRRQNAEWPLLLPMVKATVRAMDAGQAAAAQIWNVGIERYTVAGGSKRGWTAWLTAAVDERVTAIAPLVFDALNMAAHFPHQTEVWGAPSASIKPYTDRNLHNVLSTDEGRTLREIVDPFAYLDALRLPKLIVNATNDEFFPVDSVNLYWRSLEGPRYALYLPNSHHSSDELGRVFATLNILNRAAAGLASMPSLDWHFADGSDGVSLCVRADPAPSAVALWTATSTDRDFRDEEWRATALPSSGSTYQRVIERPASGYIAFYAELSFGTGEDAFSLTTTPAVAGRTPDGIDVWSAVDEGNACGSIAE
jgi:PhoPQ-activated pathogenicity-related protein